MLIIYVFLVIIIFRKQEDRWKVNTKHNKIRFTIRKNQHHLCLARSLSEVVKGNVSICPRGDSDVLAWCRGPTRAEWVTSQSSVSLLVMAIVTRLDFTSEVLHAIWPQRANLFLWYQICNKGKPHTCSALDELPFFTRLTFTLLPGGPQAGWAPSLCSRPYLCKVVGLGSQSHWTNRVGFSIVDLLFIYISLALVREVRECLSSPH